MKEETNNFTAKTCLPCEGIGKGLSKTEIEKYLKNFPSWRLRENKLEKTFLFDDHYRAVCFVNAVVFISQSQNHHPYITLGFKDVKIVYYTHALNAITENDFICIAKVDQLQKS